eukprot:TRINITY_DN2413_c0_g1_i1.p1 TRINITY_DN2413_c0_g1~~TRINITY_DN2413_c0_g1_i1.p1  ORF type:complete len:144 (-),score=49.88 TRINITY_DN2413_c0_g1_i1:94-462(-)
MNNFMNSGMMKTLSQMRDKMSSVSLTGKAGENLVVVRFRKNDDFSSEMVDIDIKPEILERHADRIPGLVKEAVNDALRQETQVIGGMMPKDKESMESMMKGFGGGAPGGAPPGAPGSLPPGM